MSDLPWKPCPFCGSCAMFVKVGDFDSLLTPMVYISCGDCGAGGPGIEITLVALRSLLQAMMDSKTCDNHKAITLVCELTGWNEREADDE